MMTSILTSCGNLGRRAKQYLKQRSKPVTATLLTGALSDLTRSRADLIAENVMLRQQLIVLKRQVKRPHLTHGDRLRLVVLARCTSSGSRPSSSSNLTPCCVGTAISFAAIGDANQGTRTESLVSSPRRSPSSGRWRAICRWPRKTGCGAPSGSAVSC